MENYIFENLNEKQREAVVYKDGPLAIIAGAGSGKTKTITNKIAYLIQQNIKPNKILAITFTNKSSNEMNERVQNIVKKTNQKVNIMTYHSLCARILREDIDKLEIPRNFNILDDVDQKFILSRIYKELNINSKNFSYYSLLSYISKNKVIQKNPKELIKESKKEIDKMNANIYNKYNEELKKINSLDFDDLLLKVYELFRKFPNVSEKWSDRFDYILVDEFQDTSFIQYEIIKLISKKNNITIVGDPDQTIYTWRKANPNLIYNFQKDFPNFKIIKLENNYRSTQNILDIANKLIKNNKKRIDKKLICNKEKGEEIKLHNAKSEEKESNWVVQQIDILRKKKTQLKNIAILYRVNYLSSSIEKALIDKAINYIVFGGVKFFQRQEIKDVISYLKIIQSGDEIALMRMINVPSRKIGEITLNKIVSFAKEKKMSIYNSIMNHFDELEIANSTKEQLAIFFNLINKYKKALKTNSIHLVISNFLSEIKYYEIWNSNLQNTKIENVKELINSIKKWENENIKKNNLEEYLNYISLYLEKQDYSFGKDFVSLMTVHASKGLEFDNVFLIGFSDGIFPSKKSFEDSKNSEDALEEERRLAYVAITRAKERLYISNSRDYFLDYKFPKPPSRFLKEMGMGFDKNTNYFLSNNKFSQKYKKGENINWKKGDKISHIKFGIGVVLKVFDDTVDIEFNSPFNKKTLMKNHVSLERI